MAILRKDMPISKDGRSKCCVYGVIDPKGQGRDMVCGTGTKKFWDKDSECYSWEPWCWLHKPIVLAQEKKEMEEMEDE